MRGLKIEKDAHRILDSLSGLNKELETFQGEFQLVGKHISNAMNKYEEARRRLDKFGFKLEQIESQPVLPLPEKENDPNHGKIG